MSLRPQDPPAVPEETRRVAQAAFRKGTLCIRIADALGTVYQDNQFASEAGPPWWTPMMLSREVSFHAQDTPTLLT